MSEPVTAAELAEALRELRLAVTTCVLTADWPMQEFRGPLEAARSLLARYDARQAEASKPASEPKQLKVWQYDLPSIKGEGWAKVLIREDGFFSAVSDWGNFAFIWGSTGEDDVRKFFLRMDVDSDYFARKFDIGRGNRARVDTDASVESLKRALLMARRIGEISREQAAEDWENIEQIGDDWESLIRLHWNFTDEPWSFAENETSDATLFVEKIGPRLVEAIRRQLTEEPAKAKEQTDASKPEPECTGYAASWCPRCGDCTCCDSHEFTSTPNDKCPLHGLTSTHAEPKQSEVSKPARDESRDIAIWHGLNIGDGRKLNGGPFTIWNWSCREGDPDDWERYIPYSSVASDTSKAL